MSNQTIRVAETFGPTVSGEGAQAGIVTLFVRVGGCDYRCAWCDSLYAVDSEFRHEWKPMRPDEIVSELQKLAEPPMWVTLSGGNPAIPEAMPVLIRMLREKGYRTSMETQGSVSRTWFYVLDSLVVSPKPPSSQMTTDWEELKNTLRQGPTNTSLKVVIASDEDYQFAIEVHRRHPDVPFFVQPCNLLGATNDFSLFGLRDTTRMLMEKVAADPAARMWRVIPQLHTLAWGATKGV